MAGTNYTGPLSQGEKTGNPQTQTVGYVKVTKQVSLGSGDSRKIITIPPNSTLTGFQAVPTSAFTGGTDLRDMNVNIGTSADPAGYSLLQLKTASGSFQDVSVRTRQVSLNAGGVGRVDLPPKSTLLRIGAIMTSAFAPADAASAAVVNFGTPTDFDQYGIVTGASAKASLVYTVPVSGSTEFDAGGTIAISCSAVSTNVTTGGGVRAFVEYVVADNETGAVSRAATSGAASFDSGGTIVVTLSAAATTTFTGGGARVLIEYVTVE